MSGSKFLGVDLTDPEVIPYFTWDEPLTVRDLHERLRSAPEIERLRLLGRILREARDTDAWFFTTPAFVARNWEKLSPYVGRRRAFWQWLLERWREDGLLAG